MSKHLTFLSVLLAVVDAAAFPRYNSTSLSISPSTISSAFIQQVSFTASTTVSTLPPPLSPSFASQSHGLGLPTAEQHLAPSRSTTTGSASASRSGASTSPNASAAYGTATPSLDAYLSIAQSIQSARSNNATIHLANQLNVTLQVAASTVPGLLASNNLNTVRSFTRTRSLTASTTTTALGVLVAAVDQVASLSGSNLTSVAGPAARMASSDEEANTTNVLSILFSALPSDVASSLDSVVDILTGGPTSQPTTGPSPTAISSRPDNRPPPMQTPSDRPFTPSPTTSLAITSTSYTSFATSSTLLTVANHPTTTSSTATPSATVSAAPSSGGGQLKNASVAGIATGLAAGAVLFALAGIYLFRRRQQGKPIPFFGGRRNGSNRSSKRGSKKIFPEVAWLYDPSRSPRDGSPPPERERGGQEMEMGRHSRQGSVASLIPEPREGAFELPSAPNSPPQRPSSPLLSAPLMSGGAGGRNSSPEGRSSSGSGGRRSHSGSPNGRGRQSRASFSRPDLTRPMSAIWEEPNRASMDARTGLLAPGTRNVQRHST